MCSFKELIRALTKILKSGSIGQAAIEYFIILSVVVVITVIAFINFNQGSGIISQFFNAGEELFQKAVNGILGD